MDSTCSSLLARLRTSENAEAWTRFVNLYTPLLLFWATRAGLSRHEAEDLTQEVFTLLVQKMPEFVYKPERSFRGWLRTVALNLWHDKHRKKKLPIAAQPADVPEPASPDEVKWLEEEEYRQLLIQRALQIMKADFPEESWKACWEVIVEGRKAQDVAARFATTPGAVHAAKFRIMQRLRQELAGFMD